MENDLISIIVPCYNAEKTIDRCIESVVRQTYSNWEMVIVNDGSNDSSETKISRWIKKDHRIKYIQQKNAGVSTARNKGMQMAKGRYFAFLDADDWYELNFLQILQETIKEKNTDIASCAYRIENELTGHDVLSSNKGKCIFYGDKCLRAFLFNMSIKGFMCNKLFKAELLKEKNFRSDLKLCEDMEMLCQLYTKKLSMAYVNKALYHYWIVGEGATQSENILISKNGGIQAVDNYMQMKQIFCNKKEQLYFYRVAGDTIVDIFYSNNKINKFIVNTINQQIKMISRFYYITDASIKKKLKFFLIQQKIKKVWRKDK